MTRYRGRLSVSGAKGTFQCHHRLAAVHPLCNAMSLPLKNLLISLSKEQAQQLYMEIQEI
jgi:hypothetical protein